MSDEVQTHHAQILDDGGCANDFRNRIVNNDTVAGVVVAGGRVVEFTGDIEGNLCLPVVVRRWVQNGIGYPYRSWRLVFLIGVGGEPATL